MRYTGPVCKLCRREGDKLYLKGSRCFTAKCSFEKRQTPPGLQSGQIPKKQSEYGIRLRAKQKARRYYGMSESQFSLFFARSAKQKGVKGLNFLTNLERRLDSIVFRLGLAASHSQARQLVRHGHIVVNGHRIDIPSYLVSKNDVIAVAPKSTKLFETAFAAIPTKKIPSWLNFDLGQRQGHVLHWPTRDEIDVPVNEQFIVEYYSR